MRTFIYSVFFSIACTFTGSAAFAQTRDGVTPADESVCDALKADGVTKGLHGLCIAYCEAEAQSENVLENYNRKRAEDDPEMPCVELPLASCPCWTAEVLQAARDNLVSPVCSVGTRDEAIYFDFLATPATFEGFGVDPSTCAYIFDPDLSNSTPVPGEVNLGLGVTPAEEVVCRMDIASLCQ